MLHKDELLMHQYTDGRLHNAMCFQFFRRILKHAQKVLLKPPKDKRPEYMSEKMWNEDQGKIVSEWQWKFIQTKHFQTAWNDCSFYIERIKARNKCYEGSGLCKKTKRSSVK